MKNITFDSIFLRAALFLDVKRIFVTLSQLRMNQMSLSDDELKEFTIKVNQENLPQQGVICNPYTFHIPYKPQSLPALTCKLFKDNTIVDKLEFPVEVSSTESLNLTFSDPTLISGTMIYRYKPITVAPPVSKFNHYGHGYWKMSEDSYAYPVVNPIKSLELHICIHSDCIQIIPTDPNPIGFLIQTLPSDQIANCPPKTTSIVVGEQQKCIALQTTIPEGSLASQFVKFPPSEQREYIYFLEPATSPSSTFQFTTLTHETVRVNGKKVFTKVIYEMKPPPHESSIVDNCRVHEILSFSPLITIKTVEIKLETTKTKFSLPSNLFFTTPSKSYGLIDSPGLLGGRTLTLIELTNESNPVINITGEYYSLDCAPLIKSALNSGFEVRRNYPNYAYQSPALTLEGLQEEELRGRIIPTVTETEPRRGFVDPSRDKGEGGMLANTRDEARYQFNVEESTEEINEKLRRAIDLSHMNRGRQEDNYPGPLNGGVKSERTNLLAAAREENRNAGSNQEQRAEDFQGESRFTATDGPRRHNDYATPQVLSQSAQRNDESYARDTYRVVQRTGGLFNTEEPFNTQHHTGENLQYKQTRSDWTSQGSNGNTKREPTSFSMKYQDWKSRPDNLNKFRVEEDSESSKGSFDVKKVKLNHRQKKGLAQGTQGEEGNVPGSSGGKGPYVIVAVVVVALILFFFFFRRRGRRVQKEEKERENSSSEEFLHNHSV